MHFARAHAAVFLFCAIRGAAQAPADKGPEIASHDAPTTFTSKVNLVMVPVVVRDGRGKAIGTLKKEDFQLFDKGKPQTIVRFAVEKSDGRVAPIELPADATEEEKKAAAAPVQAGRFTAYVFDDMHTAFGDLALARKAAVQYLNESLQPVDRAAIYTTSGQTALEFTDDKQKLTDAMNHMMPRSRSVVMAGTCPYITEYQADLIQNKNDPFALNASAQEVLACGMATTLAAAQSVAQASASQVLSLGEADTQVTLAMLKAVVQRMSVMPGQRTIVLVSSGFLVTQTFLLEQTTVIERAIRSNVTISTLDARGLWAIPPGGDASQPNVSAAATQNRARYDNEAATAYGMVLGEFADGTGGTAFHNNNDLREGFQRTGASPEFMYVLAFSPQNLRYDGAYHSLKVTAKDTRGVTLQARHGYYAPKHAADPAEDAREEIRVALFSREEMLDIPVDLQTQFFKPSQTSAKLAVLARVDLKHLRFKKSEGRNRNTLSVVSAVFDRNGVLVSAMQKDVEMKLRDETFEARIAAGLALKTSFDVPPGTYVVRVVVRDSEGQTMAARNRVVEIP